MTTGKFTLVIRWPSGQSTICGEMTDHQHGEICRILSPDYRAQLPSQGGEAVAVVAYIDGGGAIYTAKLLEIMSVEPDGCEQLMTVAQHQRILDAATHPSDQVAEGDAELVELLREAREFAAAYVSNSFFGANARKTLSRIDAKLASLKP